MLTSLNLATLASLYNLIAEKPVSKFKDKQTGVARLEKLLAETDHEVFEADDEYDVRPVMKQELEQVVAPTPVAPVKGKRGRKSNLTGKKLQVVREKNPKRAGTRTAVRYELYREVKTSDEFIKLCEERGLGTRREILSDLDYDSKQEFIKLS